MDFLTNLVTGAISNVGNTLWQNVIGPILSGTIAWIPLWVWIILGGVLIGYLFKKFGWQGVLGGLAALLLWLAYREGWKAHASLDNAKSADKTGEGADRRTPEEQVLKPLETLVKGAKGQITAVTSGDKKKKKVKSKVRYNPDTNKWEPRS